MSDLTRTRDDTYTLLAVTFCVTLVICACLGSKIILLLGITLSFSAFAYPITFLITDSVAEIYGKKSAQRIVFYGLAALLLCFAFIHLALIVPAAPFWENQDGFRNAFGLSARLILAGTLAYLVSQMFDVWFFHKIKAKTNGKHLWLRNNASTACSQAIDTAIFVFIGFYGVAPLFELFIGQYLVKLAFALFDTPIVYLLCSWLRSKD